jgi:hypothetical protein
MRVVCAFCFYHADVEEDDREAVCENCGIELLVYEDGSTEVVTNEIVE